MPEPTETYDVAERRGPTWRQVSKALVQIATEREEWAGIPVPLPDTPMVLEPRYPHRFDFTKPSEDNTKIYNMWHSKRLRADVCVIDDGEGKRTAAFLANNTVGKMLHTIGASVAWPLEAEKKAIMKLADMVSNHAFLSYMLTGTFIETSKRSKVSYIFRKLRPTVAIRPDIDGESMRILCTLCLHPVGYYAGTWAGVMCPTDDVIAHLSMMRGDEAKFWANANQHQSDQPESGL